MDNVDQGIPHPSAPDSGGVPDCTALYDPGQSVCRMKLEETNIMSDDMLMILIYLTLANI